MKNVCNEVKRFVSTCGSDKESYLSPALQWAKYSCNLDVGFVLRSCIMLNNLKDKTTGSKQCN